MMPARLGMTVSAFLPDGETMRRFAERIAGRELAPWEFEALEAALRQAEQLDHAKRLAWDRAELELTLCEQIREPWPIPTLGPGLGEPGRIASALRCARRRKRNRAAAKSRRRNRR